MNDCDRLQMIEVSYRSITCGCLIELNRVEGHFQATKVSRADPRSWDLLSARMSSFGGAMVSGEAESSTLFVGNPWFHVMAERTREYRLQILVQNMNVELSFRNLHERVSLG